MQLSIEIVGHLPLVHTLHVNLIGSSEFVGSNVAVISQYSATSGQLADFPAVHGPQSFIPDSDSAVSVDVLML